MKHQAGARRPEGGPAAIPEDSARLPILILAGPTGVGKTDLAVELARRHRYHLISADSMQMYRGMAIGTGQPSTEELKGVPLHGCGVLDPAAPFDVRRFLTLTEDFHARVEAHGATPLYVGGTGMYLRALRWGLVELPAIPAGIRDRLEAEWAAGGAAAMFDRLRKVDPELAGKVAHADRVRIVRGLEVHEATGRRLSALQHQWDEPSARFAHRLIVLSCPRDVLGRRIDRRVDAMFDHGWVDEVRALLRAGYPPSLHAFKAIGYREIIEGLRDGRPEREIRESIKTKTRQFAKRQLTWFRKEREARWIEYGGTTLGEALDAVEKLLESAGATP